MNTIQAAADAASVRVDEQVRGQTSAVAALESLKDAFRKFGSETTSAPRTADALHSLQKQIQSTQKAVTNAHRGVYHALNRLGKAIENVFPHGVGEMAPLVDAAALHRAIIEHLIRTDGADFAHEIAARVGIDIPETLFTEFSTLNDICAALDRGVLGPALDWVASRHDESDLALLLHRTAFLRILFAQGVDCAVPLVKQRTNVSMALAYAREHLGVGDWTEIKRLLAALVYVEHVPVDERGHAHDNTRERLTACIPHAYKDLCSAKNDLKNSFFLAYCRSLGLPQADPLRQAVDLGANRAVGMLTRAERVVAHHGAGWTRAEELPIEVPVPVSLERHSIFVCPNSKEITTEENPPMLLVCGHVISRDSMVHIKRHNERLKCPYCPAEMTTRETMRVYY